MQHAPISRARYVQENRKMRFQKAYDGWSEGRLTQAEAAPILGQCERSFRRHIERLEADGLEGLLDKAVVARAWTSFQCYICQYGIAISRGVSGFLCSRRGA